MQLLAFESFGKDWVTDVVKQLKLPDAQVLDAPYGQLPDTCKVRQGRRPGLHLERHHLGRDAFPNADFIAADRDGITICDATSAAFAQALDWAKLDVADLLLAEGAGRRGRARRPDPVARAPSSASRATRRPGRCPSCSA